MCYNTRQDILQSFMIFGVTKVFILYFTKWPKNRACQCYQHIGRPHGRPMCVCVFVLVLTEDLKISYRRSVDRAVDRPVDRAVDRWVKICRIK
jgi:hypothetical protein